MKTTMTHIGNFFFQYRNRLFPLIVLVIFALQPPRPAQVMDWLALTIALSGLAFRSFVIGYAYIKRGGLNKKVYAENLVTEGLFGVCRNPLYVGNMLIYVGVFLLHGSPLVAVVGIATFLFIYQCIIYAEEAFLRNKFGVGYDQYCREVARWIPNFRTFGKATEGMKFNAGRAIKKDYSTIATTLVMLALAQIYKHAYYGDSANIATLIMAIVAIGVWAGLVRYFKKRGSHKIAV